MWRTPHHLYRISTRRAEHVLLLTAFLVRRRQVRPRRHPMSEKSLRGTRLGSNSLESEVGVEPVERHIAEYHCPQGHVFTVPFAFDADVPALWACKCGAEALLVDAARPTPRATKPVRTHWDMLLERRSVAEL